MRNTEIHGVTSQNTVQLPEDGGSRFLRNTGTHLPNCTASHPREQYLLATIHGIVLKYVHNHIFLSYQLNKNILNLLVSSARVGIAQSV
jgi:hypothetical protein